MMRLAPSCRPTRHSFLWRQTSGCPKKFASPQRVQWASAGEDAQLQGSGNLNVGEAERGLEGGGSVPDPA
jgi:hypothetical protein